MADKHTLKVTARDLKRKARDYRQDKMVIGNIYGLGDSQAIAIPINDAAKLIENVGESTVIYITIDDGKKELPVLLDEIQRNPTTSDILHIAFRQVSLKEKVKAFIPFELVGEEEFKVPDAVYLLVTQEVEAEALPTDLPEQFTIDLSKLTQIGDQVTFAELDYDRNKVTLLVENLDTPVLVVNKVEEQVEEEPAETTETTAGEETATATAGDESAEAAGQES